MDLQHDWSTDLPEERLSAIPETFISMQRRVDGAHVGGDYVPADALNEGQRLAFDHVVECFRRHLRAAPGEDAHGNTIIMGTAGVGKSFLIRALETEIWHIAKDQFGKEAYPNVRTAIKLVAFTEKAAFQVGGVTIHSLLSIGNKLPVEQLPPERLRDLQRELKNTHFLFIDEMSMVGLRMLNAIDHRLRAVFPANHDVPFGGLTVVMFGDFAQLPPVMDSALYSRPIETSPTWAHHSSKLYNETFTHVFHLQQQMRQHGHTETELKFATLLAYLRTGEINEDDWRFMQTRVLSQLPPDEARLFQREALALFPTNDQVRERNLRTLKSLHKPVARISAKYIGIKEREGSTLNEDYCGGMQHVLFLCVGARVLSNIAWLMER